MAYSQSDESEVDKGKKVAESVISPTSVNVTAESLQEGLAEVTHDAKPADKQQELPRIAKPIEGLHDAVRDSRNPHDPPHDLHQAHHKLPRDAHLSRDVLYHRDSHNHRYTSLQPRNYYGPTDPRIDSEFTTRDGSPALESHRDTLYAHGERERSYPSRYSPVPGPDYARRNDLDERRGFGGGPYRDSGYPQGRARNQDSRWMDNVHSVASSSSDYAVPRAFSRDHTLPPPPPSS
ncbi:hypothetical protein P692DRAFT_20745899 [Suillus brevipes Sb2]|nr:hypothetical protein P692DRAFT_20745899 [Suillus brevipes Sb2]